MKIAVVGCLHGELDIIYEKIEKIEKDQNIKIDLLLVCGDFQAIRNENDLKCMSVPPKYRRLGTFHQYYFGDKIAPVLTLLIGGNHEASNYLQTLPFGGWVAPNMYYLGFCSIVNYGPIRIGGISGIFKQHNAQLGHFEHLPYNGGSLRSVYHMRETEIYKLLQLKPKDDGHIVDVFMSHDWPINIHQCASDQAVNNLLKRKPHFRQEVEQGRLGNPLLQPLVHHLKPKHWFAAHLHAGFKATVFHPKTDDSNECIQTEFQALDKVIPGRYFLHIVDLPTESETEFELKYDLEWLAILKKTDYLSTGSSEKIKGIDIYCSNEIQITQEELSKLSKQFEDKLLVPKNFELSKPVISKTEDLNPMRDVNYTNPQTTSFCSKLGIWDTNEMFCQRKAQKVKNPDECDLGDSDEDEDQTNDSNKRVKTDQQDNCCFIIDTKGTLS